MTTVATYAKQITRRIGCVCRGFFPAFRGKSEPTCDPAISAWTPHSSDGGQLQTSIKVRGLRLHNRNSKGASAYERVHVILAEGLRK